MMKLTFTPYAWAKLQYCLHAIETEISFFGVSGNPEYPLLVSDLIIPLQECTETTTEIDGDCLCQLIDEDIPVNIWIHTHPEMSANPSGTDLETWRNTYDIDNGFAIMAIVSKSGDKFAELKLRTNGLEIREKIPVDIDWEASFEGSDWELWDSELTDNVIDATPVYKSKTSKRDPVWENRGKEPIVDWCSDEEYNEFVATQTRRAAMADDYTRSEILGDEGGDWLSEALDESFQSVFEFNGETWALDYDGSYFVKRDGQWESEILPNGFGTRRDGQCENQPLV
jgi:proteasome lid subunit RPN8/RPN11